MANAKDTGKTKQKAKKSASSKEAVKKTETEIKEVEVAKQKISTKNLLIGLLTIIVIIFIGIYIYKWQQVKNEEKLMTSYLLETGTLSLEIKNLDEVDQILTESPNEYFVLITYTGNEDTYKLEKDIKEIIDNYKLSDSFYYLNVENIMEEDNYLTRLNNAFNTNKIEKVPIILYYKNGKIIDTVKRNDDNVINSGDFQKLLDIYEYEGQ